MQGGGKVGPAAASPSSAITISSHTASGASGFLTFEFQSALVAIFRYVAFKRHLVFSMEFSPAQYVKLVAARRTRDPHRPHLAFFSGEGNA